MAGICEGSVPVKVNLEDFVRVKVDLEEKTVEGSRGSVSGTCACDFGKLLNVTCSCCGLIVDSAIVLEGGSLGGPGVYQVVERVLERGGGSRYVRLGAFQLLRGQIGDVISDQRGDVVQELEVELRRPEGISRGRVGALDLCETPPRGLWSHTWCGADRVGSPPRRVSIF